LISLYVFGEEEEDLTTEAENNGGVVTYDKVKHHHYKDMHLSRSKSFENVSYLISVFYHTLCFMHFYCVYN